MAGDRREYLPYAIIETHFVFTDYRFISLPPVGKTVYLMVWCRAFVERRSTLPAHASHPLAISRDTGADKRTVSKMLQKCFDLGLLSQEPDGRITVIGVDGKGNLKWKDEPPKDEDPPHDPPQDLDKTNVEGEGEGEEEEEKKSIPSAGEVLRWWNDVAAEFGFAKLRKVTDGRYKKFQSRLSDGIWDERELLSSRIRESKFLQRKPAEGKKHWFCFDWIIKNAEHTTMLLEGKYSGDGFDDHSSAGPGTEYTEFDGTSPEGADA